MVKKKMTVAEAGRKGGLRTLKLHGAEHFKKIAKKPRRKKEEKT